MFQSFPQDYFFIISEVLQHLCSKNSIQLKLSVKELIYKIAKFSAIFKEYRGKGVEVTGLIFTASHLTARLH